MAIAILNKSFSLLRKFDLASDPYNFQTLEFSPNLITMSEGGHGLWKNEYSGVFDQADDGRISGTITSVTGLYHSDAGYPPEEFPDLIFTVNLLDYDLTDFAAEIAFADPPQPLESLLLSGDDVIYGNGGAHSPIRGYAGDDRLRGSDAADDQLYGDGGDDTIYGSLGDDTLVGGDGNDLLNDGHGQDRFVGGAGNDFIAAKRGDPEDIDTAVYAGISTSYTIALDRGAYGAVSTIIDRVDGRDGTDQFSGVERLEFLDRTVDWDLLGVQFSLNVGDISDLANLYIAYFDRAPDALGLYYWMAQMEDGMALENISQHFSMSSEAQRSLSLNGPAELIVTSVYENVLNRAPDAEGVAFWVPLIKNDLISRDTFVLEILKGTDAAPAAGESADATEQRIADAAFLQAKTNLGLYFAGVKGLNDVEGATSVFDGFDGSLDSIAAGKALVDDFYAEASDPLTGDLLVQFTGIMDDPFYV